MDTKTRILLIDTNYNDRQFLVNALKEQAFEITLAATHGNFEVLLASCSFDLILVGNIPDLDELKLLRLAKEKSPHLPLIIVTHNDSENIAVQNMRMGALGYIIKSEDFIQDLVQTIKTQLKYKRVLQERKVSSSSLKENENLYRTLFERLNAPILISSLDGKVLLANEFACDLFGYSKTEIKKIGHHELFDPTELRLMAILDVLKKFGTEKEELTLIKKSGFKFPAEVSVVLLKDNENPERIGWIFRDLTEQKQTEANLKLIKERAEDGDRLKKAFLQNISHEIRNPVTAILGFSGLLKDPQLAFEKGQYYSDIIEQSAYQLLSIVNDIVSAATIEAGQSQVKECEVNINKCIRLLYDQFIIKANKKNLLLQFTVDYTDSMANILTDETKLIEILSNLISNALKFTNEGCVSFGYYAKENNLEFYVQDTGIGIPVDMHEEIFNRFRQLETHTSRKSGGTGLGLSISKAYVEMLGGRIWLNSDYGKGSVFYFTIPVKRDYEISVSENVTSKFGDEETTGKQF